MPLRLLKLANQARKAPEVVVVRRILLAAVGLFVLIPVATNLMRFSELGATDYIALVVFTGVGTWLLRAAVKGPG
jgi:hypothetical protein